MVNTLVLASSSHTLKYDSYFRSLFRSQGTELTYILVNSRQSIELDSLEEQYLLAGAVMTQFKSQLKLNQWFLKKVSNYIYPNRFLQHSLFKSKNKFILQNYSYPTEVFFAQDVLDLKISSKKKITLELQKQGVRIFDHLLVESSVSNFKFLQSIGFDLVEQQKADDLVWQCFKYVCTHNLAEHDFWLLDSSHYDSLFDNLLYLQIKTGCLHVWAVVPDHQKLNSQFLVEFQNRLKMKIEKRLQFLTLSSDGIIEDAVDLGSSLNKKVSNHKYVTEFPNLQMCSVEKLQVIFDIIQNKINKHHKIKG